MNIKNNTIQYYSKNADRFYEKYDQLQFEQINSLWIQHIPSHKHNVLDIGAGSGRDAIWLAQKGHDVIAVEPADGLRELAEKRHPHRLLRWVKDGLPHLQEVNKLNVKFDLILVNAVWMHIAPEIREKAFENIIKLMKAGGHLVVTLRYGPSPDKRVMYPVTKKEILLFAKAKKLVLMLDIKNDDLFNRSDVSWRTIVFKMAK